MIEIMSSTARSQKNGEFTIDWLRLYEEWPWSNAFCTLELKSSNQSINDWLVIHSRKFLYRWNWVKIACRAPFHAFGPSRRYRYGVHPSNSNDQPNGKSVRKYRTKHARKSSSLILTFEHEEEKSLTNIRSTSNLFSYFVTIFNIINLNCMSSWSNVSFSHLTSFAFNILFHVKFRW